MAAASMALSIETRSPSPSLPFAAVALPAVAYLALTVDPAVTLTLGVVLTPFAGNWQQLGIPGILAPDRLLIAATIVLVVLRAAIGRGEPLPRPRPVHFVLALAMLWVVCSALVSHTLFQRAPLLKIVEAYGLFPFLIFYLAPVIYTTRRKRQMLLTALVVLGAYLGLTVLFEMAGANALVWPKYILDPNYGLHYGRAEVRSPTLSLTGSASTCVRWPPAWQRPTGEAAPESPPAWSRGSASVGTLLTLERSVWTGAAARPLVRCVTFARLRRFTFRHRHGGDWRGPRPRADPRPVGQGLGAASDQESGVGSGEPHRGSAEDDLSPPPDRVRLVAIPGDERALLPAEPELSAHRDEHRHPQLLPDLRR